MNPKFYGRQRPQNRIYGAVRAQWLAIVSILALGLTAPAMARIHVGAQNPTTEGFVVTSGDSGSSGTKIAPDPDFTDTHAWEITGTTTGRLRYEQAGPAANDAWVLSTRVRVTAIDDEPDAGMLLEVANGERRFLLLLGSTAAGTTLINIEDSGFPATRDVEIPPTQPGRTDYIHLELTFQPAIGTATLFVNGIVAASGLEGIAGTLMRVNFGDGGTALTGGARFAHLEFNIGAPQCADGIDNNGDGLIDHAGGDALCTSSADNSEGVFCPIGRDLDNDGDCELVFISHEGNTPPTEEGWVAPASSTGQDYDGFAEDPGVGNCEAPCPYWRVTDNSQNGRGAYTLSEFPADAVGGWELVARVRTYPYAKENTAAPHNARFMQALIPTDDGARTGQFATQFGHAGSTRMLLDPPTRGSVTDIGPISEYHEVRLVYNPDENNVDVVVNGALGFTNRNPVTVPGAVRQNVEWGSGSTADRGQTHWQQVYLILNPDTDNDGLTNEVERNTTGTDPFVADADEDGVLDGQEVALGSDPNNADSDGDSLLDGFEIANGLNPTVADDDSDLDGDGLTNRQEQAAGSRVNIADTDGDGLSDGAEVNEHDTDPTLTDTDGDGLNDFAELNQHATNPVLADSDGDGLLDGDELNNRGTSPTNRDSDGDGLEDARELSNNTNPLVADTDGDGLLDGFEVRFSFDPLVGGEAELDTDNDGISNVDEQSAGSDPTSLDTDGDGLSDGDELLVYNSDPTATDTDEDGLTDSFEITWGLNPAVLDDANADPDNDGLSQLKEQQLGTNPTIVDSDSDGLTDGEEVNVLGSDPLRPAGQGVSQQVISDLRFTAVNQPLFTDAPEPLQIDIPIPDEAKQSLSFGRKETIRNSPPLAALQRGWERGIDQCASTTITRATHPSCKSLSVTPTRAQCINGGNISIGNRGIRCCVDVITKTIDPIDKISDGCAFGNTEGTVTINEANDRLNFLGQGRPIPTSVNAGPARPKPTRAPGPRDYTIGAEFDITYGVTAAVEIAVESPDTGTVDVDYRTQAAARVDTSTAAAGDMVRIDLLHSPRGFTREFTRLAEMSSRWPKDNLFIGYRTDTGVSGGLNYWSIDPDDGDQIMASIPIVDDRQPEVGRLVDFEFIADERLAMTFMKDVDFVPEGYRDFGFEITSDDFLVGGFLSPGTSIGHEFTNPAECPKPDVDGGDSNSGGSSGGDDNTTGPGCNNLPKKQPVSKLLARIDFQIPELNTPVSEEYNGGTLTNFSLDKIIPDRGRLDAFGRLSNTLPNKFRPFLNYTSDAEDKPLLQSVIDTFLKDNTRLSSDSVRFALDIDGIVAPGFPSVQGGIPAVAGQSIIEYNLEAADLDVILFAGWDQQLTFDPGVVADLQFNKQVQVQLPGSSTFTTVAANEVISVPLATSENLLFRQPAGGVDITVNYSFRNNLFDNETYQTVSLVGQLSLAKAGVGGIVGNLLSKGISSLAGTEFPLDFTAARFSLGSENFNSSRRGEINPLVPQKMDYSGGVLSVLDVAQDTDMDGLPDALENASCTSATDADSDDDGLPDSLEDKNRNGLVDTGETDPCNRDSDNDSLTDGAELGIQTAGSGTDLALFVADASPLKTTDPAQADTDGDGLNDGDEETVHNTDPRNADSDGDGVSDGDEVNIFGTDPNSTDTDTDGDGLADSVDTDDDNDGIDDVAEVAAGLDPLDASDATKDADGDGVSNLAEYQASTDINSASDAPPQADQPSVLATAVLPGSRSTTVDSSVSAFATLINSGAVDAEQCGFAPLAPINADFAFQRTRPETNELIGEPNRLEDVPAGTAQTYAFFFTPLTPLDTEIDLRFNCANTAPAQRLERVNTFRLQASVAPTPDIVALVAAGGDGIARLNDGVGAFAVATANVGAADWITARAIGPDSVPLTITLCRTNATTGVCENPALPVAEVMEQIDENEVSTFSVFLASNVSIPLNAAANRVFVEFVDSNGVVRGTTSVAVTSE